MFWDSSVTTVYYHMRISAQTVLSANQIWNITYCTRSTVKFKNKYRPRIRVLLETEVTSYH